MELKLEQKLPFPRKFLFNAIPCQRGKILVGDLHQFLHLPIYFDVNTFRAIDNLLSRVRKMTTDLVLDTLFTPLKMSV